MKLEERIEKLSKHIKEIVSPANIISFSRPALAWYGLEHFMDQEVYLSMTLAAAFTTDAVDGIIARYFKQSTNIGGYVDIACDRALELITLWTFANKEMIPYAFPILFTVKGVAVDGTRVYKDWKRRDFSRPLRYGNNNNKVERAAYGLVKGTCIAK
ncbi:MAG: CDP-alcohol phosphatidyltransferase family protein [Nanoarchaeota archaeon]